MTKADIFNLSLGALLLSRQITDAETDSSNEAKVLRVHWQSALDSALEAMDLDSTKVELTLTKVEDDPTPNWLYAYTYPSDCVFLRRLQSTVVVDNRYTHIPKLVANYEDQKVIFTNKEEAIAEYISRDIPLSSISANACLAIAYRLAYLSAPLIVGKGASALRKTLKDAFIEAKGEAQEQDKRENFNFESDDTVSEFVAERTS